MNFLKKYGIRFGVALLAAGLFHFSKSAGTLFDFLGLALSTFLVVALSYVVEAWFKPKVPD